jgi:hypothetical protein
MIRGSIQFAVEDDNLEELLTMIRDFDRTHPNGLFKIASIGGDRTVDEMKAVMQRLGLPIIYTERNQ